DETQELTRGSVRMLREFLAEKRHRDDEHDAGSDDLLGDGSHLQGEGETPRPDRTGARSKTGPDMLKRVIIQVEHRGRRARLLLNKRPSTAGWAWLTYEDGGNELEARLADMKLVALIEG
ncbi:MAG: chromosome partitioning protein ParB, partial [Nitrospira sp.]|nr:chromosome partitioning protein ParB [Nitrospira sp.]